MPDLEQDEKDKRHEKGDEGGCVDGDDVFTVLDDGRSREEVSLGDGGVTGDAKGWAYGIGESEGRTPGSGSAHRR